MISLNLRRLCALRGIKEPYAFLRANGFSHYQAHALGAGAVKEIKFTHIEKLCRIFRCMPQDLLDYRPTAAGLDPTDDVLAALRKEPVTPQGLQSLMATLPTDEVVRLTRELQDRYGKPGDKHATT